MKEHTFAINKKKDPWFETEEYKRMAEHRKKEFAFTIGPSHAPHIQDAISLCVTYNGDQWESIGLTPSELKAVSVAIQKYIEENLCDNTAEPT